MTIWIRTVAWSHAMALAVMVGLSIFDRVACDGSMCTTWLCFAAVNALTLAFISRL